MRFSIDRVGQIHRLGGNRSGCRRLGCDFFYVFYFFYFLGCFYFLDCGRSYCWRFFGSLFELRVPAELWNRRHTKDIGFIDNALESSNRRQYRAALGST